MKKRVSYQLLLALGLLVLFSACQKDLKTRHNGLIGGDTNNDQSQKFNTFKGPEVHMGNGKVRSFIILSHTGVPQEIGFEITDGALKGLPTGEPEYSFMIPLHQKAQQATAFDHLEIDWNPFGHPPPGVYDVPHFDFHFYKITTAEQEAIPEYTPATAALFDKAPPAGYLPIPPYIPIPGGVAQMGKHWADVTSPELNGAPFTQTFIYGTYNGAVTFIEPMVTLALLQSGKKSSTAFPQPQYFSPNNTYYPTLYNVYMDSQTGMHYVTLSGFVWR